MPQMWLFQLTSRRRKDVMAKNQDKALLYALDYMQNKITKKPLYPKPLYYNPPPHKWMRPLYTQTSFSRCITTNATHAATYVICCF